MKNRKVWSIVIALFLIVGVFGYLNYKNTSKVSKDECIVVKYNGKEKQYSLKDIKKLGEEKFKKEMKSKGKSAKNNEYTGIQMKKLIENMSSSSLKNQSNIIVTAKDGYKVSYKGEEVLQNNNVYIVFEENGQKILDKKTKKEVNFMTLVCKDQFAQRWCKDLMEIEVK